MVFEALKKSAEEHGQDLKVKTAMGILSFQSTSLQPVQSARKMKPDFHSQLIEKQSQQNQLIKKEPEK